MKKDDKQKSSEKNQELEIVRSQLARALADYDNLKKRVEVERETTAKTASYRILIRLLPIIDILEVSLKHTQDQGLAIALGEFKKILNEENLIEIKPDAGDEFNEQLHEVIEVVNGNTKGKIAEVTLPGWQYNDGPVVRHAKVKVYSGEEKGETN